MYATCWSLNFLDHESAVWCVPLILEETQPLCLAIFVYCFIFFFFWDSNYMHVWYWPMALGALIWSFLYFFFSICIISIDLPSTLIILSSVLESMCELLKSILPLCYWDLISNILMRDSETVSHEVVSVSADHGCFCLFPLEPLTLIRIILNSLTVPTFVFWVCFYWLLCLLTMCYFCFLICIASFFSPESQTSYIGIRDLGP